MKISMKEIVINNRQLKNIINNDLQNFIINWANYKKLINKCEILEDQEYENQLINNIQFLTALKDELNTNNMLNIELLNIFNDIIKKCWKVEYFGYYGIGYHHYFDTNLKQKILNNYNKNIKFSNQKQIKEIIANYFKTEQERNNYENWKKIILEILMKK